MNKEEILQASRNENQNKDLYELEMNQKAQRVGGLIALTVTFALMVVERVWLDIAVNYGYFLIVESAAMGLFVYKAVKLKRKSDIFAAVLWSVPTIYAAVMVVMNYIG